MKQESVRYTYKFMHDLEEEYYENVLALLSKCNHEFVPTLSSRKSTTEKNLAPEEKGRDDVPYEYFEALKKQCFVLVFAETSNNGRMLVGFLSYIPEYSYTNNLGQTVIGQYVSTIIVSPSYRNQGIARQLYEELFRRFPGKNIFTRTWSSDKNCNNISHLTVLTQIGFQLFECKKNDRGKGIDTVYYHRKVPALIKT